MEHWPRTIDIDVDEADDTMRRLAALGVDMDDIGVTPENQGIASFHESFRELLAALDDKASHPAGR